MYSHDGHIDHVTLTIYIIFRSPFRKMLHINFGFDWPSGLISEEKIFEITDGRTTTDGRRSIAIL